VKQYGNSKISNKVAHVLCVSGEQDNVCIIDLPSIDQVYS